MFNLKHMSHLISLLTLVTHVLLYKASLINIVNECYEMLNLKHMSQLISERKCRLLGKFHKCNELCNLVVRYAIKDRYHMIIMMFINMRLFFVVHACEHSL